MSAAESEDPSCDPRVDDGAPAGMDEGIAPRHDDTEEDLEGDRRHVANHEDEGGAETDDSRHRHVEEGIEGNEEDCSDQNAIESKSEDQGEGSERCTSDENIVNDGTSETSAPTLRRCLAAATQLRLDVGAIRQTLAEQLEGNLMWIVHVGTTFADMLLSMQQSRSVSRTTAPGHSSCEASMIDGSMPPPLARSATTRSGKLPGTGTPVVTTISPRPPRAAVGPKGPAGASIGRSQRLQEQQGATSGTPLEGFHPASEMGTPSADRPQDLRPQSRSVLVSGRLQLHPSSTAESSPQAAWKLLNGGSQNALLNAHALPLPSLRPQTSEPLEFHGGAAHHPGRLSGLITLDEHLRRLQEAATLNEQPADLGPGVMAAGLLSRKPAASSPSSSAKALPEVPRQPHRGAASSGEPKRLPSRSIASNREVMHLASLVLRADSPQHAVPPHSWALPTAGVIATTLGVGQTPNSRLCHRSPASGCASPPLCASPSAVAATVIPTAPPLTPSPRGAADGERQHPLGAPDTARGPKNAAALLRSVSEVDRAVASMSMTPAGGTKHSREGLDGWGHLRQTGTPRVSSGPGESSVFGTGIQRSVAVKQRSLMTSRQEPATARSTAFRRPPAGALLHLDESSEPLELKHP
jgi:hypothetical protein